MVSRAANTIRNLTWVAILIAAAAPHLRAQTDAFTGPPAIDVLGAHADGGRGCAGCHVPHNDASGTSQGQFELWGNSAAPDYGLQFALGEPGHNVEIEPASFASPGAEVSGVVLCVSCHDGNITAQNMMAGQSYEQMIGLLPFVRRITIPSLLTDPLSGWYSVDHPLGVNARIETGEGLEFTNGKFAVKPDSPYAHFVESYGWPTLAPLQRVNAYGVDTQGRPYLLCTTCHNQHAMSTFVSQDGDTIAGGPAGQMYSTFFFVNGPYTPETPSLPNWNASTTNTQFCRQCHFNLSNEANGALGIQTVFR